MVIAFKKEHPEAKLPIYKTKGSAGADLYSVEKVVLRPGDIRAVSTGLQLAQMEEGYELQIRTRSGMALKGVVVANSPGTIDSDYRGKVLVILINMSPDDYVIEVGDRIAQMMVHQASQFSFTFSQDVQQTERGAGGLGSTGR